LIGHREEVAAIMLRRMWAEVRDAVWTSFRWRICGGEADPDGGDLRTTFVMRVRDLGQWFETAEGQLKGE